MSWFLASSSENEGTTARRELFTIARNFSEPRPAVLSVIAERNEVDSSVGSAIVRFYTRRSTPQEREGHRIEDGNRLVYERFDETDLLDRRVNEGKKIHVFYLTEKEVCRLSKTTALFTISVVRRYENTGELPSPSNYLHTYMRRVRNVARAQELRWVHNMAEDEESALHSPNENEELLERARESFRGAAEE